MGKSMGINDNNEAHPDILRCKMVAALLKEYGIRHIVVSSGARDVSLVRLLEENDFFITHNVTDERSAAYYAIGIATYLNEAVAITCTSGTAVSNYLPGITEAYHMKVPIAVLSCDRYPYFEGQMEAQKIDHLGALESVVKYSAELSIGWDDMIEWDTRRKLCEGFLELTHHGNGPIHINIPMNYLENKYPPEGSFELPNVKKIDRINLFDNDKIKAAAERLKTAKRVLLISGQSEPPDAAYQSAIDEFCKAYNCVLVTDHLSNIHNDYEVNPFFLLRKTDVKYFRETLMPDLVIYFGGKRVLNCPLQEKMRRIPGNFEFWRVDADGKVADLYRKLTHVFEMTPMKFFKAFSEFAGDSVNNKDYLSVWQTGYREYPHIDYRKDVVKYSAFFTIGSLFDKIPKNSLVHLGVGTAFNRAHYFYLDPSVKVYCNMGTNGIDGSASTFMGQAAVSNELCFLIIGDLSFFYDMNSVWNKPLNPNLRILLNNDGGAGFLKHFKTDGITQAHNATAKGWVEGLGFEYMSATNKDEYENNLKIFLSDNRKEAIFLESFVV